MKLGPIYGLPIVSDAGSMSTALTGRGCNVSYGGARSVTNVANVAQRRAYYFAMFCCCRCAYWLGLIWLFGWKGETPTPVWLLMPTVLLPCWHLLWSWSGLFHRGLAGSVTATTLDWWVSRQVNRWMSSSDCYLRRMLSIFFPRASSSISLSM